MSTLNHFYFSERIIDMVSDAGALHHPDNTSDHEPIYCVLKSITLTKAVSQPSSIKLRPSWRLASKEDKDNYKYMLDTELGTVMIPTQMSECHDPHCKN